MKPRSLVLLLASCMVASPALAQEAVSPTTRPLPPKCDTPAFRQFDFWVGDWNVTSGGEQAGTNNVTMEEEGCLIHEHWKGSEAMQSGTGQSFNFYDRADHKWHQVWVDSHGQVLVFVGEYWDGRLVLAGQRPAAQGRSLVQHKLTFFRNGDGTVRQLWEASRDGGKTWRTVFDGLYRKRA